MILSRLLVAFIALTVAIVLQAEAIGQQPSAPGGLRAEQELPSRYPYVVYDALNFCRPNQGFWVDLGAGRGQVAIPLVEATGNPVMMLDPDRAAMAEGLAKARERGLSDRLSAVAGVAEDMPLLDNSVDFLISRGSIFFWDDPVQGLREVQRVLRPGGKAYIGGGEGSGYPKWATDKLIQNRKARLQGDDRVKWQRFIELRRPEQMEAWASAAGLTGYRIMGRGAVDGGDGRVGQGIWLTFEKVGERQVSAAQ